MTSNAVDALRRALTTAPNDIELRLHLVDVLVDAGRFAEAITEAGLALQQDPLEPRSQAAMASALRRSQTSTAAESTEAPGPERHDRASTSEPQQATTHHGFDWSAAEHQVRDVVEPMFVAGDRSAPAAFDIERPSIRLADVGGMEAVKERLEASFLAPLRNPELRRLYAKSLRGGLLLWGPPGCGKTFLARALAGELGAGFMPIGVTDVLDPFIGNSERNLHELFQVARRAAPCVVFLDELDGLGQRRGQAGNAALRNVINQLLVELDGIGEANEGVFLLAATNQPWDVDPALRRPGRLDRSALVLPPDERAREAIFRHHLRGRPIVGIDPARLASKTEGLSGADIALICESATEQALLDGVRSGTARLITQKDLQDAASQVRSSIGAWLDSARTVVTFGDDDGTYGDLRRYLKKTRRL